MFANNLARMDWHERYKLAQETEDQATLHELTQDECEDIRLLAVINRHTSEYTLESRVQDSYSRVCYVVAQRLKSQAHLDYLAHEKRADIQDAVTRNSHTSSGTLNYLFENGGKMIRRAVFLNQNAQEDTAFKSFLEATQDVIICGDCLLERWWRFKH